MGAFFIGTVLANLKEAAGLAQSLLQTSDPQLPRETLIELRSVIFLAQRDATAAKGEQTVLLARLAALEREVARLKDAERERGRTPSQAPDSQSAAPPRKRTETDYDPFSPH